jgi:glycosyltransferase involved in cell wall biosynthesis
MKIVFFEMAGKGGMIHYAFQLCRALAESDAEVTLITEKSYELAALPHPFRVEPILELWDPKPSGRQSNAWWAVAFRKLRRVRRALRHYGQWLRAIRRIDELQPDLVLLGDIRFPLDLFPLLLLRRKTRRLADICHNVRPFSAAGFQGSSLQRFFYRRIYRLFDVVFVHYERNRDEFMSTFGVPAERVGVIVHGNEEIFRDLRTPGLDGAALRQRLGIPAEQPIVLFFGTLSRYKGTDVLLHAFPRIHERTGARLVLAGFPFHDFDLAAHQKLAQCDVTWVPEYIDSGEVAAWMELASVIVFPYRDIYQSGALHIPQTFGVPIVASAIGAIQDVVQHEVSGLLTTPESPDALAGAVIRLLEDRDLASRLGQRAAEDAQGRYSWRQIAHTIRGTLFAESAAQRRARL